MGFRYVALAFRNRPQASILADMRLEIDRTGVALHDSNFSGVRLEGWYIVYVFNSVPWRSRIDDRMLALLSSNGEVLVCGVNEGTMVSSAAAWSAGRQLWSVLWDPNFRAELVIEGDPPADFARLAGEALVLQAKADDDLDCIFEVPVDLFRVITGWHLDAPAANAMICDSLREAGTPTPPSEEASRWMDVEDKPAVHWPLAFQARAAIDVMTPQGGPGFMVLTSSREDYMQAVGGDGAYLAEWREYQGTSFRHFVAGRSDAVSDGEIRIATNGAHVTVKRNEQLGSGDIKRIATAFLNDEPRPSEFAWRDVSDRFE